jgi:hypothetical protein
VKLIPKAIIPAASIFFVFRIIVLWIQTTVGGSVPQEPVAESHAELDERRNAADERHSGDAHRAADASDEVAVAFDSARHPPRFPKAVFGGHAAPRPVVRGSY